MYAELGLSHATNAFSIPHRGSHIGGLSGRAICFREAPVQRMHCGPREGVILERGQLILAAKPTAPLDGLGGWAPAHEGVVIRVEDSG